MACVSCHTGLPYLLARPALRHALKEKTGPTLYEGVLVASMRSTVIRTDANDLFGGLKGLIVDQVYGAQVVLASLVLAMDDQPRGRLSAEGEKAFERLGGTKTIPIDVRLVAATNRDLTQMMGDKLFRSDLYYRLKVFPITTPPLRDHPEDIPLLARHFTRTYSSKMNRDIDKIPAETMHALVNWQWPGNVRELENFIERSVILSTGASLRAPLSEIRRDVALAEGNITLEHVEREHIVRILRESGGVVTMAATRLGLHRTTLNAMMRKLGITRSDF